MPVVCAPSELPRIARQSAERRARSEEATVRSAFCALRSALYLEAEGEIDVMRMRPSCRVKRRQLPVLEADEQRLHRRPSHVRRAHGVLPAVGVVLGAHAVDAAPCAGEPPLRGAHVELRPYRLIM